MPITLATANEMPAILDLLAHCVTAMRRGGIDQWDEIYPDRAIIERDIAEGSLYCFVNDGYPSHASASGRQLQGIVVLNEQQSPEYANVSWKFPGRVLVVHRLAIEPACQGRGLAKMLMLFAEELARREGYAAIRLDTFPPNSTAVALYQRLGYRKAGVVTFRKGLFYCFEKRIAGESSSRVTS